MDDQQQDTEVFESPRDPASALGEVAGSIGSAASAAWDEVTNAIGETPSGADGPAGGGQSGGGGSTDPWDAPSAGESGGVIEAYEREEANHPAADETPPTGPMSDDQPDSGIPADAETFIQR